MSPRPPARRDAARKGKCPKCHRPVLQQLVGRQAAVSVTADAEELTPAAANALREPDRLDWCLRTVSTGLDLRWTHCHAKAGTCPHPHVIDHRCPSAGRPTATSTKDAA